MQNKIKERENKIPLQFTMTYKRDNIKIMMSIKRSCVNHKWT
jgi:hypothetical protein